MRERAVWKYPLRVTDDQRIWMPIGAALLTVAVQHGTPQIWALVDPDGTLVERRVLTAGTGHPVEGRPSYVASYQLLDGDLVFHVFDGGEDYADPRPPDAVAAP